MERCCQPGCEHGEAAGALRLRLHLPEQGPGHITELQILTVLSILCQGLGCPVGSVIVGSRALIDRAVRVRKVRRGVTWTPDILIEMDIYR